MTLNARARTVLLACAVAATFVAVTGCATGATPTAPSSSETAIPAVTLTSSPAPTDSSTSVYGVKLDALVDHTTLRTTEGQAFQLPAPADYVLRIPAGWLYGKSTGASAVYLLTPDGTARALAATIDRQGFEMPGAPVVSADGTRIAWAAGGSVHTGQITTGGLTGIVNSPAPGDTWPLTWVGTRVILGHTYAPGCCGYNKAEYDVWDPAAGNFAPHWTRDISPIYGPVPTGVDLFAVKSTDSTGTGCLAPPDAVKDLSATTTICGLGLHYGSLMSAVSPDGRHIVDLDFDSGSTMIMVDLTTVTETKASLHTCSGDQPLAWEDSTTAVITDQTTHAVYRCAVDNSKSGPVAGLTLADNLQFVPRIGLG